MGKINVKSIILTRAEGPAAECDKPQTVTNWSEADKVLEQWSKTAPKDCKTYDKCDFIINYEDGETYKGRYDLKHWLCEPPNLAWHVRDFVTFHAGKRKPSWMTDKQYEYISSQEHFLQMKPQFERFLENYEILGVL